MTGRPGRTTTLVGPNRVVLGAAPAGLVALASAGTALLVLTGTSSVAPAAAPAPPLPSSTPHTRAPGVVVLPSDEAGRLTGGTGGAVHGPDRGPVFRVPDVAPVALAFTDVPAPQVVPAVSPPLPAVHRSPTPEVTEVPARPGRHLAKGHAKHGTHAKLHGKRVGWSHSRHYGNR